MTTFPSQLSASPRRAAVVAIGCGALALAAATSPTRAQDTYPSRPITVVIPFPPGGSADVLGRIIGKRLSDQLGQPVVIDNRPGAGTVLGASAVAKAPADGYTLLVSSGSTFTVNPAIRPNLPYDPIKSFDPIAIVARIPLILVANKDVPVNSVKEFVATAKASPDKFAYASFGSGTTSHFAAEIVLHAVGAKMTHVPYKGSAPSIVGLVSGEVQAVFSSIPSALGQIRAGKIRALAVSIMKRSSALPDVPTIDESGVPGYDAASWYAVLAPAGTPKNVTGLLGKEIVRIMAMPEVRGRFANDGFEPAGTGPAEFAKFLNAELAKWEKAIRMAGIQPE
jgi:tripartite-type tricarboxylate transporter receptor subunit TctC